MEIGENCVRDHTLVTTSTEASTEPFVTVTKGRVEVVSEVSALNERRREALLRASEKQELLLQNLLDAVERHRQELQEKFLSDDGLDIEEAAHVEEAKVETVVEQAIKKQLMALTGLKTSVELTQPSEEPFVEERLNLLEDASHRQLEIMESLIDAVQKLDSKVGGSEDRLRVLERIAENQNLMLDKLSTVAQTRVSLYYPYS